MQLKKLIYYSLSLVLLNSLISCGSKKMAFFRASYPSYTVKVDPQPQPQPESIQENISANTDNKIDESALLLVRPNLIKKTSELKTAESNHKASEASQSSAKFNKAEKKNIKKELRKIKRESLTAKSDVPLWVLVLLAIFIPPLAVYFVDGISTPFWIDLVLTIIFWIPGAIYALIRIFR